MPHDTYEIRAVKAALRRDYALNGHDGHDGREPLWMRLHALQRQQREAQPA